VKRKLIFDCIIIIIVILSDTCIRVDVIPQNKFILWLYHGYLEEKITVPCTKKIKYLCVYYEFINYIVHTLTGYNVLCTTASSGDG